MNFGVTVLALQVLSQAAQPPVLEFPETGVDDPAAYEGYATRFFRDTQGNAFQIYLNTTDARVVHVWADASNASAAFTVRDAGGVPARVGWGSTGVVTGSEGQRRTMRHQLTTGSRVVRLGWFTLGTMRQERDFQYWEWHRRPFDAESFVLDEFARLVNIVAQLPRVERDVHLGLLNARTVAELRARLRPRITQRGTSDGWTVSVELTSLDGRNVMTAVLRGQRGMSEARVSGDIVEIRAVGERDVTLDVTVTTDASSLTPLTRSMIFNDAFDAFYDRERRAADGLRQTLGPSYAADPRAVEFRRLERAVLGLELLSYREKLMAALPNYATYFGRDMMMAAMMLEPIISVDVQEFVITNALRKMDPSGDVSHEEALGGQAIRENAAEYATQIEAWRRVRGSDSAAVYLDRAREILTDLQTVRENYRMIDDDFQLPILTARYLGRDDVPAERKQRFMRSPASTRMSRLDLLARNLALVAERTRAYVDQPVATNLVGFLFRDADGWFPGSWRDSRVGYGMGRFAMDVNVVWVPHALEATATTIEVLDDLGLPLLAALEGQRINAPALKAYLRHRDSLEAAIATWQDARRHFMADLTARDVRASVERGLASMGEEERAFWQPRIRNAVQRPLSFLVLSLDERGRQIPAPNTDPATDLFLGDYTEDILQGAVDPRTVLQMIDVFVRPYPVGLFVENLGELVVNDLYADSAVQQHFRDDLYHSPRVVWGREVNLLLLGLARQIENAYDEHGQLRDESAALREYVATLRRALDMVAEAVDASGMSHNELWSYRVDGGALRPIRYGASSDIQLWNLTDLAVRFQLDRLPQ